MISGAFALLPFATDFKTLAATAALAGAGNGLSSGLVMTLGADSAPVAERGEVRVLKVAVLRAESCLLSSSAFIALSLAWVT